MSSAKRTKGHAYERQIAKVFNNLGYNCVTSRSESRRTDDAGIDLCYTEPFAVQCKAWESAPSYHKVLASMPQKKGSYNLLFHKRNNQGSVVVLKEEDFLELLEMLIQNKIISPK
jgi:hypothetical protein